MKKIIHIVLALFLVSVSANAQFRKGAGKDTKKAQEKIKALKIAHITEQLDLTESEAEKFWPIYNKYDNELMSLRFKEPMNLKKRIEELGGIETMSDADAKNITKKIVALDKALYETKQAFFKKLSNVLSYKKILQLEIAEKDFHRKLLRKFRGKHKPKN